ncbi:MAG: radical SAM protein, partial [Pseudomonadota bacterium]
MNPPLPLSVYIHLPWCVRKCPYCDFNSHTAGAPEQRDRYLAALLRDLEHDSATVVNRPVSSVFLGGGTPSLFSPGQIDTLLRAVRDKLDVTTDA